MRLTDIQQEWEVDSKIDELNLGREALKTPNLHSKYITYLSKVRLLQRKAESEYLNTRRLKYRYYRGEMGKAELESVGWDQFQGTKPLKNEMDEYLQCDKDLIELQDKIEYYKTIFYTLEQIIKSINARSWDIKSSMDWQKFTNGVM